MKRKKRKNQKVLKDILSLEDKFRKNVKKILNLHSYLDLNKTKISPTEVNNKNSLIRSLQNQNTILLRKIKELESQA